MPKGPLKFKVGSTIEFSCIAHGSQPKLSILVYKDRVNSKTVFKFYMLI